MKILRRVCALLIATGLAMPAQDGWAQLATPSAGPQGVGATVGVVILVVAVLLILRCSGQDP